jgi:uncharacterized protein (TIGR02996 family)
VTHEEAFIQAIREDPDDDGPRLIFADWLEEHGDPRGEFIRVQCELARLPQNDPKKDELWKRERRLLQMHEREWLRELRGMLKGWRFQRGFVDDVSMGVKQFLANAEVLFRKAPVQHLRLHGADRSLPAFAASPRLVNLASLEMNWKRIGNVGAAALFASPHFTRLRTLELSFNQIGDVGLQALPTAPALKQLRKLELQKNQIGDAGVAALANSPALAELTELGLWGNQIGPEGAHVIASSPHLGRLKHVSL